MADLNHLASTPSLPDTPWARDAADLLTELGVSVERGLSRDEVRERQRRYGPNELPPAHQRSAWAILFSQVKSMVVVLLLVAAAVAFALGEVVEGAAIAVVILINSAIGFATEMQATRSMDALRRLGRQSATVRRAGRARPRPACVLVPGDIVILDAGDVIVADLRLTQAANLQIDESTLTGESMPVEKSPASLPGETLLAERANMAYRGTAVTRGSGEGVVVATGGATELGRISRLTEETEEQVTPLEKRLDRLGQKLVWLTLVVAASVLAAGLMRGRALGIMVQTTIALAVATIPEGLPIVATAALARGVLRMARRHALVNRLAAVETLGATTIIATDKTGTLTENRMTVMALALPDGEVTVAADEFLRDGHPTTVAADAPLRRALEVGALCSGAELGADDEDWHRRAVGDPMEVALLIAAAKGGVRRPELLADWPEQKEHAFDSERKLMATVHGNGPSYRVTVKGAPESILEACAVFPGGEEVAAARERWRERNAELARDGLRVLALAEKTVAAVDGDPYRDLQFVGLVGLLDPPREDVREAIAAARAAGVRTIMATGDQEATALNVARAVDLADAEVAAITGSELKPLEELSDDERQRLLQATIFTRVSPEQKLHLIRLHQSVRAVIAMTGDGVNDAPALKQADIGIAMGQRGTQVAREAADMVLLDDAFATIVSAIEQGRVIFRSLRRFVVYLLSCNTAEVAVVGLASLANAPLPILPLQILLLNLVTDVFPALALGMAEGEPGIMKRPPRDPAEPILARRHWVSIAGYGAAIAAAVLGALALALLWRGMEVPRAITVSFLTLAFAQLWHVFNMRDARAGIIRNDVVANRYVWGALVLCVGLLLGAVYLPVIARTLQTVPPGADGWAIILVMSALPLVGGQALKVANRLSPSDD